MYVLHLVKTFIYLFFFTCVLAKLVQNIGPRVVANFGSKSQGPNGVIPGAGRGILASVYIPVSELQSPGSSRESVTSPPVGRGRGRGLLLMSD